MAGDDQRRGNHQLDRPGACRDQRPHRGHRRVDVGEVKPCAGRPRRLRDRLEHGLGDEAKRSLGADQQAAEDLDGRLGVEEGAQPVAGRVLDLELAPDALAELGVGADLVTDLDQPAGELGLGLGEPLLGVRGLGVDHGPGGRTNVIALTVR